MPKKEPLPPKSLGEPRLEKISANATQWIGSVQSLIVHTVIFIGVFSLSFFGFDFDRILLILTTLLSFEAIYLAIFIQMTVNRNTVQLHEVEKDIEEISEDIEDIQEDVEEISEEDGEEEKEEEREKQQNKLALAKLEQALASLLKEIEELKKKK